MLVSLKEFAATGAFGPITLGCSRSDLERHLGAPEDVGGTSRKVRRPTIWKYGDVEFFFPAPGDTLEMIHIDRFSGPIGVPIGWGGLSIDPWIIREGLLQEEFVRGADAAGLSFSTRQEPSLQLSVIEFSEGLRLSFIAQPDEFSDFIGLASLSCAVSRG